MGRRADGYHLLDSLIAFAAIGDVVGVAPAEDLHLTVDGPFAPALPDDGDNLVLRAARLLQAHGGEMKGADITLTKNLPVAAGLGGGSADAAAALRALNDLWRLKLADRTLSELGLVLGADVPVCLHGRCARIGGVGEEIHAAPSLPAMGLVLINPGVAISTAEIFRKFSPGHSHGPPRATDWRDADGLVAFLKETQNDLVVPARQAAPVIGRVLEALDEVSGDDKSGCLLARMSGTGATCFGLFADHTGAAAAAAGIARNHPGWWVECTGFTDRAPVVSPAAER
jgi:4-diphosphocytidyl-2-C-methyl-D-erythritol kinase